MKGIAFFLEGDTEYDFILKLLRSNYCELGEPEEKKIPKGMGQLYLVKSLDGQYCIRIRIVKGGNIDKATNTATNELSDEDSFNKLKREGYSIFICLRDVRGGKNDNTPYTYHDIVNIKKTDTKTLLSRFNSNNDAATYSILSVMEIETWFIAETSHYERMDKNLTKQYIEDNIEQIKDNINPFECSLKKIEEPSDTLKSIYKLSPKNKKPKYGKDKKHRNKTINILDYYLLTTEVAKRIEEDLQPELSETKLPLKYNDKFGSLLTLVNALDKFFGKSTTL